MATLLEKKERIKTKSANLQTIRLILSNTYCFSPDSEHDDDFIELRRTVKNIEFQLRNEDKAAFDDITGDLK